jgi:HK97 family phage portal protein
MSGAENAGMTPILEAGLKLQPWGLSPKDMDWNRLERNKRLNICSIFNVAPELIGDSENKTYSNFQEARRALYLENILPRMDWLRDELNNWLAPLFGDNLRYDYDRDSIEEIREDRSKLITDLKGLVDQGTIDRDEARAELGYAERGGPFKVPTVSTAAQPLDAVAVGGGEEEET